MIYIKEVNGKISTIKKQNRMLLTNAYLNALQLERILQKSTTKIFESEETLIIIFLDNDVYRLLYYVSDAKRLVAQLDAIKIPSKTIMEIVAKNSEDILLNVGNQYRPYAVLQKMTLKKQDSQLTNNLQDNTEMACKAELQDASEINKLFNEVFDEKVSHLPTVQQIEEYIKAKEVTVIREPSTKEIAAVAIFQKTGAKMKYLFQIAVKKFCRGKRYGEKLLMDELIQNSSHCFYSLWVESNNKKAISLYKKHGFASTNLETRIYVLN